MQPESFYHIYNRGNNREHIFYTQRNYNYFLEKVERHFLPHLDILAYCLMRNHFHFLVYSKENVVSDNFSDDLKIMLRSYTRGINNQENRTGSLFQQHTKVKPLDVDPIIHPMNWSHRMTNDYPLTCFHYIHQNPLKAKLIKRMEDYEWSSFRDYLQLSKESLCNRSLTKQLLDLPDSIEEFRKESYRMVDFDDDDHHSSDDNYDDDQPLIR